MAMEGRGARPVQGRDSAIVEGLASTINNATTDRALAFDPQDQPVRLHCTYLSGIAVAKAPITVEPESFIHAVGYHEAGHAVIAYTLGRALSLSVEIYARNGSVGGLVDRTCVARRGERTAEQAQERLRVGRGDKSDLRILDDEALITAAGPAAGWKYSWLQGHPRNVLNDRRLVDSDFSILDDYDRTLAEGGHLRRYAFRERAWRQAQLWVDIPGIWEAVTILGNELAGRFIGLVCRGDDALLVRFDEHVVRVVMRRCGIAGRRRGLICL